MAHTKAVHLQRPCKPSSQGRNFALRAKKANRVFVTVGTWNVRSVVDTEGPVEVASQRSDGQRGEDWKVDQMVYELGRYGVVVGALQETKPFGNEVYEVGDSVVLTAGRSTPAQGENRGSSIGAQGSSSVCMVSRREAVDSLELKICFIMPAI